MIRPVHLPKVSMLKFLIAVVVAILLLSVLGQAASAPGWADLAFHKYGKHAQLYVQLMQKKHYKEAFDVLLSRKNAGDNWAMEELGNLFFNAPPELARVRDDWVNMAAKQGDADAQFFLGYMLMHNLFSMSLSAEAESRVIAEAVGWLDKAADQGHKSAIAALSQFSKKKFAARGIKSKYFGE